MDYEIDRIVGALLESERVSKRDLENMLQGYSEQEISMTIWRARQVLRIEHGIDLIPKPHGYLSRATPKQTVRSALQRRQACARGQIRAADRIRLASEKTEDEKEAERFGRLADRAAERAAMAKRRI